MAKAMNCVTILLMVAVLFLAVTSPVYSQDCLSTTIAADYMPNAYKAVSKPIWQITKDGTNISVQWVDATNPRFAVYDNSTPADQTDDAVLDKETGLVWERFPDSTLRSWENAVDYCFRKKVAGRRGWRLATIGELASLAGDDTNNPSIPTGHPFSNIQSGKYWSTTGNPLGDDTARYIILMAQGLVGSDVIYSDDYCWCVRGGQGQNGF